MSKRPGTGSARPATENATLLEVLLVYKKSKLALYAHERKNERFQELLDRGDEVARGFVEAHEAHLRSLREVKHALREQNVPFKSCYRARLTEADTKGRLVVTVGGDGTLLDASHRIADATVLGVNSDPERSVGFLCAARAETFTAVLEAVKTGRLRPVPVARLAAHLDGEPLRFPVLNEVLVAHKNPAATSRYLLAAGARRERHKSSGVWIAGPAGSTAAIASAGGVVQPLDDVRMQVRVREPYLAEHEAHALVNFFAEPGQRVELISRMREGVIFVDGPHKRLAFPLGAKLTVSASGPPLSLVVTDEMRRRRATMQDRLARPPSAPGSL